MILKRALPVLAGVALSMSAMAPAANAQFTSDEIVRQVVAPININSGVDGALMYDRKRNRTDFTIYIENLPAGAYTVTVGGVFRGFLSSFQNNQGTEAELIFSTRQRGDRLLLNFEPRGQLVEIRSVLDEDRLYASGRLPFSVDASENEPPEYQNTKVREEFQVFDGSFASGRIDIKSNRRKAQVNFRVRGLVPGVYNLLADGLPVGSLVAIGRGKGNIRFSTNPRGPQSKLVFDPTGVEYELVRKDLQEDLMVMRTTVGDAQNPGGDLIPLGQAFESFTSSGFDADGNGKMSLTNDTERAELKVELDGLPEGNYLVIVEFMDQLFALGNVPVSLDMPEPEPEPGEGEGEGEGEEMPEEPEEMMLPQGVGPDEPEPTSGSSLFTTDGLTLAGSEVDENGDRVQVLPPEIPFDLQGLNIIIIDEEDRAYLLGKFPDTTFPLPMVMEDDDEGEGGGGGGRP